MNPARLLFLIVASLVAGCAISVKQPTPNAVAGFYESVEGGFNEMLSLDLWSDGTYGLTHSVVGCVLDENGVFSSWGGKDEGRWALEGDRLILHSVSIGTDRSPYFLPAYCGSFRVSGNGTLTSEEIPAIPCATPTRIVLKRKPVR